jgi:hypothetical protein
MAPDRSVVSTLAATGSLTSLLLSLSPFSSSIPSSFVPTSCPTAHRSPSQTAPPRRPRPPRHGYLQPVRRLLDRQRLRSRARPALAPPALDHDQLVRRSPWRAPADDAELDVDDARRPSSYAHSVVRLPVAGAWADLGLALGHWYSRPAGIALTLAGNEGSTVGG